MIHSFLEKVVWAAIERIESTLPPEAKSQTRFNTADGGFSAIETYRMAILDMVAEVFFEFFAEDHWTPMELLAASGFDMEMGRFVTMRMKDSSYPAPCAAPFVRNLLEKVKNVQH